MRASAVVLAPMVLACITSASAAETISTKQIITTCIQKGDSPCAIGVDRRTITINKITHNIGKDAILELETYFREHQDRLSEEEKDRYRVLHDSVQRMESKLGEVSDDVKKLQSQTEENTRLLKDSGGGTQVVPNVVGKPLEKASEQLYQKNIQIRKRIDEARDLVALPGIVVEQLPAAGTKIDVRTTTVELVVSREPRAPEAQFKLGLLFQEREKDNVGAARWYRSAADAGHVLAQYNLGHLYLSDKGNPAAPELVFKYWRLAAAQGLPQAQHSLGMLYLRGYGGILDRNEGAAWLTKAAAQGLEKSGEVLAMVKLEDAAQTGNPAAQYKLAQVYMSGDQVPKNLQKAVSLYRSSADRGYAASQYEMGVFYENGRGTEQNLVKAFEWYKKAAEQGNANAQNNLGTLYMQGKAVPQNIMLAIVWFNVAASQGLDLAKTNMNLSKQFSLSGAEVAKINEISREYYERYVKRKATPESR